MRGEGRWACWMPRLPYPTFRPLGHVLNRIIARVRLSIRLFIRPSSCAILPLMFGKELALPNLLDVSLTLRPTHRDTIPGWLGRAARALLLHSIESVQPDLSRTLHDLPSDKPFTTSTLVGAPPGELITLDPSRTYTLRFTSLATDLTRLMLHAVIPQWQSSGVVLHDQPMRVESVAIETHDYADLLAAGREPGRMRSRVTLCFETPTYFKVTGGSTVRLPVPEYVFGKSLLRRWQAFSAVGLPDGLAEFIVQGLEVDALRGLKTRAVSFARAGKNVVVGFVGDVRYVMSTAEPELAAAVRALAWFARFSGVGAQTADGLGQARVVDAKCPPSL